MSVAVRTDMGTRNHPEDDLQIAVVAWAARQPFVLNGHRFKLGDFLIHCPNGGYRRVMTGSNGRTFSPEAARFKRMGVKAGVSDLFLPVPSAGKAGLWIELKAPGQKNRLRPHQRDWIGKMERAGYATAVCDDFDETVETIREYLGMGRARGRMVEVTDGGATTRRA